jgi:3-oxoacyl-(acyl-carrier-protein) synthase
VGAEIARPFDPARTGFVAAEGAAVAVLEREAIARERGAPILARVRGFGGSFDPTAPRIGWGHGHDTLAAGLARTVAMSGVDHGDVSRIVSGASGAVAGDRIEAAVLRAAWGDRPLPIVLAPKGQVGQYGGGFLAAAVLSAAGGVFGRTGGFVQEDPALGVRPFEGGLLDSASLTLVTTVASGGSAAWLLIEAA